MPDWLLVGICAAVGYGVGVRWPRRRLYSATLPSPSVIPAGGTPLPGDRDCVGLGHCRLAWAEQISWLRWRGKVSEIAEATCRDCGRPQAQIRIVYPPGHAIRIHQSDDHAPAAEQAASTTSGASQGVAGQGVDDAD